MYPENKKVISLERYMGAARRHCTGWFSNCMYAHAVALLQRQFLKPHTSDLQSLAVAGYQNACRRRLLTCCSGRIPNCMHAVAVALLQWQDTKLHAGGGC
jgi:hypothetical protein